MNDDSERIEIKPQPGPQEDFLSTEADIAFYGGAAGGGKSYALLIDPLRHIENREFRGVIFRREVPMILNPGGLWDESEKVYTLFLATPHRSRLSWSFPAGMSLKLAHLYEEKDKFNWQGAQLSYIGFDEVTHFSQDQFFYMLSRLRSMSGVPGHVRAACNPDPDSWVATFLEWWIEQDEGSPNYGLPIPERAGKLRWFIRQGEDFVWADSREELVERFGKDEIPRSVTFIPAKVTDNKILLEKDPAYLGNLMALNRVDRGRLLDGNWKIRPAAGEVFQRSWFEIVDRSPPNIVQRVRYWDRAATEPGEKNSNPDWTVGVLLSRDGNGVYYVENVVRDRKRPLGVKQMIYNTATQDGMRVAQWIEEDPGQAGKSEADDLARFLQGFVVKKNRVTKDKVTRAKPASSAAENGLIKIVRAPWNEKFLSELEAFPDGDKDDQVDAFSGAYTAISGGGSVLRAMTKM